MERTLNPEQHHGRFPGQRCAVGQRIQDWQRWHDSQDGSKYPDPDFDLSGFVAEGYAIARAVKAELPEWIVLYSDEALLERSIETGDKSIEWLIEMP